MYGLLTAHSVNHFGETMVHIRCVMEIIYLFVTMYGFSKAF